MPFAEPRTIHDLNDCWFYHVMDLPGYGLTPDGHWDLRGRVSDYIGHVDVRGKRVLDVGTASGFLTFEMEKQGAEVVSLDVDGAHRIFLKPIAGSLFTTDRAAWIKTHGMGFDKLKNAYWLAHRVLGSRSRAFYGDVYDLPPELGEFDVGVIGQILVHLSDPVRALASVLARCREQLVITEGMIDDDKPTMTLASGGNESAWWRGSTGLYREVLTTAGWQ